MIKKFMAAIFALLAVSLAVVGVWLSFDNMNAEPILLEAPEAARKLTVSVMDALCAGEYGQVSQMLYGQPELGMDQEAADPVGLLFHEAYEKSLSYRVTRDCYATNRGVAMDVQVSGLDITGLTAMLRQKSQQLLEQRVAEAEDISEVYDENNEYREDVVMAVLYDAAEQILAGETASISWDLTLECVYENGQWWIVPEEMLLEVIGCGIGR